MLNLPLLNLNQIFLEALTLLQSESAKKMAGLIDNRYNELTAKLEKLKNVVVVSKKQTANLYDKVVQVLKKLPPPEEVERMDMYTIYEHKVETITLILNIIELLDSSSTSKKKGKIKARNSTGESILLNVSQDLFRDILRDRYLYMKYFQGDVGANVTNYDLHRES